MPNLPHPVAAINLADMQRQELIAEVERDRKERPLHSASERQADWSDLLVVMITLAFLLLAGGVAMT